MRKTSERIASSSWRNSDLRLTRLLLDPWIVLTLQRLFGSDGLSYMQSEYAKTHPKRTGLTFDG